LKVSNRPIPKKGTRRSVTVEFGSMTQLDPFSIFPRPRARLLDRH
jgi:hypothetical protein